MARIWGELQVEQNDMVAQANRVQLAVQRMPRAALGAVDQISQAHACHRQDVTQKTYLVPR